MSNWDPQFKDKLLEAPDYRAFIRLFFERDGTRKFPKQLSFTSFAARAGFSSKAFMNDILATRKRITPSSFDRVVKGLNLNASWSEYLHSQVAAEETKFHSPGKEAEFYKKRQQALRAKIAKRSATAPSNGMSPLVRVYLQRDFPVVFASLGEVNTGAELETIIQRSRLPRPRVLAVLKEMQECGLAAEQGNKFIPSTVALEAESLGSSEVFRADVLRSLDKAKARLMKQSDSPDSLFMSQTFSVSRRNLPQLKKILAETVRSFAADAEHAEGDTVAELVLGFTNNS
ncbi:MAG: hypothetical protein ACXVBE_13565 [Bdellovibrionota bacterium]